MLLKIILITLATFRISYMLVYETGPFDVFGKLRGLAMRSKHAWIVEGFNCVLCVSFWVSGFGALLLARNIYDFSVYWLGIAGAVSIIALWLGDDDEY